MKKVLLALAAVALMGCGGDSTGVGAKVEGTWNLQTVNGSPLPYTAIFIANPLYKFEILSDQFVANANGTYTETFTTRETDGTNVTTSTDSGNGTWAQSGSALNITDASDGTVSQATISGNTITVNQQGLVLIYRRQ
jgi:hypothetical protein